MIVMKNMPHRGAEDLDDDEDREDNSAEHFESFFLLNKPSTKVSLSFYLLVPYPVL